MAKSETDSSELVNRALLVSNLRSLNTSLQMADSELLDKLTIHFQNKKCSHGGDVMKVSYPFNTDKDDAIVIFEDAEDQDSAISHKQVFHGHPLTVARLPPVFTSIKAEINPLYFQIMPIDTDTPDKFLTGFQKMTNVNIDQTNYRRICCSKPIELEYAEKEIIRLVMSDGDAVCNNTSVIYNDGECEAAGASDVNYEAANLQQRSLKEIGDTTSESLDDEQINIDGSERRHIESSSKQSDGPEHFIGDNAKTSLVAQSSHSSTAVRDKQAAGKADSNAVDSSQPLYDSSVVLDKYTYKYLKAIEGPALEKIIKCYNVKINVKPGKTEGSLDGVVVSSGSKSKAKNVTKARDKFITLYQKAHVDMSRKRIDCSKSNPYTLEDAAKKTQHHFKADTLITTVDGSPNIFLILRRGDVEEVARQFRSLAGIKSSKTLRSAGAGPNTPPLQNLYTSYHASQNSEATLANDPMQFVTNEGINILVVKGDITKQGMHGVVNPSNPTLNFTSGGVTRAIVSAAGTQLERDCYQIMRARHHALQVTECIATSGFNLNCFIIHAVGPNLQNQQQFTQDLYTTFLNCLLKAEEKGLKSLAIPLIGAGYIGAPKEDCAGALVWALYDFSRSSKLKIVADVYLVNINNDSTVACQQALKAASNNARFISSADATAEIGLPQSIGGTPNETFTRQIQEDRKGSTARYTSSEAYGNLRRPRDTDAADRSVRSTGTEADQVKASIQAKTADKTNTCPICLADNMVDVKVLECKHQFCKICIEKALEISYRCPVCQMVCRQPRGNQPDGTMKYSFDHYSSLPGYSTDGVITIRYEIPSGTQTADHPSPGRHFTGATRTAYLPDNQEGNKVLHLLRKAFDARLVFTVGRSVTSGIDDIVTWNDIHHKTNMSGGPTNYGYPDRDYLKRLKEDLAATGIV